MRSRRTAAFITPPLKSTCVGHARPLGPRRTGASRQPRPAAAGSFASCRVTAASAAYGSPSSWMPTRRCRAGIASLATRGRNPSSSTVRTSSAVTSVRIDPANQLAAAPEQRDRDAPASARIGEQALPSRAAPGATARAAARCRSGAPAPRAAAWSTRASARSMLSPPSRMCSPTATRSSAQLAVLAPTPR